MPAWFMKGSGWIACSTGSTLDYLDEVDSGVDNKEFSGFVRNMLFGSAPVSASASAPAPGMVSCGPYRIRKPAWSVTREPWENEYRRLALERLPHSCSGRLMRTAF